MSKVKCYVCGKEAEGSEDKLIDMGWQGVVAEINHTKVAFEACPEHKDGHKIVEEMKRRAETFREILK
jgi:hypothetical protein